MSKFKPGDNIRHIGTGNRYTIKEIKDLYYVNGFGDHMDMSYTDANFELVEDPKPSTPDKALDEAAEEWAKSLYGNPGKSAVSISGIYAFKAGAEWMVRQGYTKEETVYFERLCDENRIMVDLGWGEPERGGFNPGDKVVVQIRKK